MTPYYEHAGIALYHGDAYEILPELPDDSDVLFLDTPGVVAGYNPWILERALRRTRNEVLAVTGRRELFQLARLFHVRGFMAWHAPGSPAGIAQIPPDLALVLWGVPEGKHPLARRPGEEWQTALIVANPDDRPSACADPLPRDLCDAVLSGLPSGATVLDPFAGSGAVLSAARRSGRRAVGIEIDEACCAEIAERLNG